jgi:hypothetical protein
MLDPIVVVAASGRLLSVVESRYHVLTDVSYRPLHTKKRGGELDPRSTTPEEKKEHAPKLERKMCRKYEYDIMI